METKGEHALPPDVQADLDEAWRQFLAFGRVTDPELARRIQERSRQAREEVFRRHGLLDIGVPAIRALRDGEDDE
jgi:hypothetical protein